MDRVRDALKHLQSTRLQQLTSLHEDVATEIQDFLRTLEIGEAAAYAILKKQHAEGHNAVLATCQGSGQAATPAKRAAAAAAPRASKKAKAATAPSPAPQQPQVVPPPAASTPDAVKQRASQAPPSRELWVMPSGKFSRPSPAPPAAADTCSPANAEPAAGWQPHPTADHPTATCSADGIDERGPSPAAAASRPAPRSAMRQAPPCPPQLDTGAAVASPCLTAAAAAAAAEEGPWSLPTAAPESPAETPRMAVDADGLVSGQQQPAAQSTDPAPFTAVQEPVADLPQGFGSPALEESPVTGVVYAATQDGQPELQTSPTAPSPGNRAGRPLSLDPAGLAGRAASPLAAADELADGELHQELAADPDSSTCTGSTAAKQAAGRDGGQQEQEQPEVAAAFSIQSAGKDEVLANQADDEGAQVDQSQPTSEDQGFRERSSSSGCEDVAATQEQMTQPAAAAPVVGMWGKLASSGSNLVSGVRSLLPSGPPKAASPTIAAGKVKCKVKALEEAEHARKREAAKAEAKARAKAAAAAAGTAAAPAAAAAAGGTAARGVAGVAASKPPGALAPSQDQVASSAALPSGGGGRVEGPAEAALPSSGGSGGAQRVLVVPRAPEACKKPTDREARQKRVEKEAEAARRQLDRQEREERHRRAEAKRKADEAARRLALEEKQRNKELRPAKKPALGAGAAPLQGPAGGKVGHALPAAASKVAQSEAAPFKSPVHRPTRQPLAAASAAGASSQAGGGGFKTPGAVLRGAPPDRSSPNLDIKLMAPVVSSAAAPGGAGRDAKAAVITPAVVVSEEDKRNIEVLMASPYVDTTTKRTPRASPAQPGYEISPYRDDDIDESPDRSHKAVPEWAKGPAVRAALEAQRHIDPDTIFTLRQTTCDLADLFKGVELLVTAEVLQKVEKVRKRPYSRRGSSANWMADRLTWQEDLAYKKGMKYL